MGSVMRFARAGGAASDPSAKTTPARLIMCRIAIASVSVKLWPFTVVVPPLQSMYNRAAMRAKDTADCTNCRRLQARVDALEAELAALKEVVAQLGRQLAAARKDSSTSSKPPSSDIVKPPKPPPPRGPGPTPNRRTTRTSQARAGRLPARVGQRRVLRSPPRLLPRVRPGPAAHPHASRRGWSSRSTSARCRCRSRSIAVIRGGARTARRCTRPRSRRRSSVAAWSGRP